MVLINGWSFTAFNIRLSFSYSEITKKRYVMICIQSIQRIRRIINTKNQSNSIRTVPIKIISLKNYSQYICQRARTWQVSRDLMQSFFQVFDFTEIF